MNPIRDALIGKTITGVITRPGRDGLPEILMLALEDGSYMQFVMPQTRRRQLKSDHRRLLKSGEGVTSQNPLGLMVGGMESQELPLL